MICASADDILVSLFNEVGRQRALTDAESRLLERIIQRSGGGQRQFWSPAEDRLLKQLAAKGWTARQISHRLGRSRDAIHTRIKKLKDQPRKAQTRGLGRTIKVKV